MSRASAAEVTRFETYPQASRWYLGVEKGTTLLEAQVDGDHAEGDQTILLKNVVCDDFSELVLGMTVAIHTALLNDRKVSAAFISYNQGTQILTVSPHAETPSNNEYVTIYSAMKLWKLDEPTWGGSQAYPPFFVMGSARAGFVDQTFKFMGANSYSPVGRTLNTARWKLFQDGVLVNGTLTDFNTVDAPLEVQYPTAGEKLIRGRCDDSQGERGVTLRPVLVYDRTGPNAPYSQVVITDCKWHGNGWSATFTVYGTADREAFPAQARVVLFAEDFYGGTLGSVGGQYRGAEEILMDGFIRDATTSVGADNNSVTFIVDSIEMVMDHLTLPSLTLRDGDDTTDWHTFSGLDLNKAAIHIIQQHTTLGRIADVFVALFEYSQDLIDVPEASLYNQLNSSIAGIAFGYVAASRYGSVTVGRDRGFLEQAMRETIKRPAFQIDVQHWMDLSVHDTKYAALAQVFLAGKDGSGTAMVGKHPLSGPRHNGAIERLTGFLFKDQTQADGLARLYMGHGNREASTIQISLTNFRFLEPAFQEFFMVHLIPSQNNRGINWNTTTNGMTGREFYIIDMSISFVDGGYILVNLVGQMATFSDAWTLSNDVRPFQDLYGYDQSPANGDTGTE